MHQEYCWVLLEWVVTTQWVFKVGTDFGVRTGLLLEWIFYILLFGSFIYIFLCLVEFCRNAKHLLKRADNLILLWLPAFNLALGLFDDLLIHKDLASKSEELC